MWRSIRTINLSFDFEESVLRCSIRVFVSETRKLPVSLSLLRKIPSTFEMAVEFEGFHKNVVGIWRDVHFDCPSWSIAWNISNSWEGTCVYISFFAIFHYHIIGILTAVTLSLALARVLIRVVALPESRLLVEVFLVNEVLVHIEFGITAWREGAWSAVLKFGQCYSRNWSLNRWILRLGVEKNQNVMNDLS
jgi:hypothetical protein